MPGTYSNVIDQSLITYLLKINIYIFLISVLVLCFVYLCFVDSKVEQRCVCQSRTV